MTRSHCATCRAGRASEASGGCPFVPRDRKAGELIYSEGQAADEVWYIDRGAVVLLRQRADGDAELARAIRRAGSFVGTEALVCDTYTDTARALSDVTLCAAPRDSFEAWVGASDSPARVALEETLRADAGDAPRGATADGSAARRVARWILAEASEDVAPAVPRQLVASMLGMVPETFSRALSQLVRSGAIETTRRTIVVRDREALLREAR